MWKRFIEWLSFRKDDRLLMKEMRAMGYSELAIRSALERGIKSAGQIYRSPYKNAKE